MVVTSNGRPIAILAPTTESTFEESLSAIRTARAIDAVAALQQSSLGKGANKISLAEINKEIELVRKQRS